MARKNFVAEIDERAGRIVARDYFLARNPEVPLRAGAGAGVGEPGSARSGSSSSLGAGDLVEVRVVDGVAEPVAEPLARAGSAAAAILSVAREFGLDPVFPPEVEREVAAILESPGLDDPSLVDLRALPFVTIDNPDSRDLDQAMFLERTGAGYRVAYALADAAYYIRPGTALFAEAAERGASYYLPGFSVPMLPRALSEGLVSLNPSVDRRAFVLDMRLDASGALASTRFVRARIHSHAKLSYPGVQKFLDSPDGHAHADAPFRETLELLREVGERRMQLAIERDVVRYRRREVSIHAGPEGTRFTILASDRNDCERWNEQLSLLCNVEGARLFAEAGQLPNLQPVFRVHEPPHHRRVAELARTIEALCARANLDPGRWRWRREAGESLASYLDRLPEAGPDAGRARAISRQALVINNRSEFGDAPGRHHGVGADAYARFSSPMRELVGVFTHKEAIEVLEGRGGDTPGPEEVALQRQVIDAGNRAKRLQSKVTKAANRVAIDAVLEPDLDRPLADRPRRGGVLLSLSPTRAYVALHDPPVELKVYFNTLAECLGEGAPRCEADPSLLVFRVGEREILLGDELELVVVELRGNRWALAPSTGLGLDPEA